MLGNLLKKIFGSRNDRIIREYSHAVNIINGMESTIAALSDADLRAKTDAFKQRIQSGETLDDLLQGQIL